MFKKLKYLITCIICMDYKSLFETVKTVHKACGKNSIYLFFDIVYCGLKYGAGYSDYLLCEFYLINKAQRETYVTRGINNTIARTMNTREFYHLFQNKHEFYKKYSKYINREWLFLPETSKEDFIEFMKNREYVMVKPTNGTCGVGVEKLKKSNYNSIDAMYNYISIFGDRIAEEVISQHEVLDKINPTSVNTLRVVTIYSDGEAHIIYSFIRIGNGDRPVDNINAGGMCAPIDLKTGLIEHVAYDKERIIYTHHPVTGTLIKGNVIPMWDEVKGMVKEMASITPEIGYCGWDVCITPNGPALVEANDLPGHDFLQLPPHVPDRIGMLPEFKKYVKGL